ncbi:MAG: zinc-ribbon domain-containing protein [Candidatus Hermodarchaeota archaeon]
MSLKCTYHPERDASEKCEKCGKLICLECKMVYHLTYHNGTGNHGYSHSRQFNLCPLCYYNRKINVYGKQSKRVGLATIIGLILLFVISLIMFDFGSSIPSVMLVLDILFLIIPILIIILILYMILIYGPKKVETFKSKRENFLTSINQMVPNHKETPSSKFCAECGKKIDPDALICSYCGASN